MSARGEALVHLPYPLPKKKKKVNIFGSCVCVCGRKQRGFERTPGCSYLTGQGGVLGGPSCILC